MWVDSKTFMELVERMTVMELRLKQQDERIKTLENRPIIVDAKVEPNGKKDYDITEIYDDLMNGVKDEKLGRVRLTDGTD
jgi:hypothetical protein